MPKQKRNYFLDGMVFIAIGLVALWQKRIDAAILFFVLGIGYIAYNSQKRQDEVWKFFWGGIKRFLQKIFPFLKE